MHWNTSISLFIRPLRTSGAVSIREQFLEPKRKRAEAEGMKGLTLEYTRTDVVLLVAATLLVGMFLVYMAFGMTI
jgi:hypothetical protein